MKSTDYIALQKKWSRKKLLEDVAHTGQTKTDDIVVSVTDKVFGGQVFEPDLDEEIRVVQEFDKLLKCITFTTMIGSPAEDTSNSPKKKPISFLQI